MIHLPFINKYPYTSFEAVNIDWLLNQVAKIPVLEDKVNQHETRITTLEETAADHEQRLTAAEGDIDDLEGRMDTAESDIDQLQDDVGTAQADINSLKGRMTTAEGSISGLGDRMTTAENDIEQIETDISTIDSTITAIQTKDQAQDNDIAGLVSRVTTLEGKEVVANPGGSGPTLNTLRVGSQVYSVPQGGGGGTGTVVTANPAGVLPTDPELSALGIDSLNYRIPVTAADKAAIEGDISDIRSDISDLETAIENIDTNINENIATLESSGSITANGNVQAIPNTSMQFTEAGTYLVTATLEVNTTNYGSTPRFIGFYFRDDDTNWLLDKFSVFGTEPSTITQAADLSLSSIIKVKQANLSETFKLCLRIQSSTNKTVDYDAKLRIVKLNDDPTT